jgi:O-succinylbenzoic acid--CoA ligase
VAAVLIIGVPDAEWGAKVAMGWEPALAVGHGVEAAEVAAAAAVRETLGGPAVPRVFHRYEKLPRLGNGKPDRKRIAEDLSRINDSDVTNR